MSEPASTSSAADDASERAPLGVDFVNLELTEDHTGGTSKWTCRIELDTVLDEKQAAVLHSLLVRGQRKRAAALIWTARAGDSEIPPRFFIDALTGQGGNASGPSGGRQQRIRDFGPLLRPSYKRTVEDRSVNSHAGTVWQYGTANSALERALTKVASELEKNEHPSQQDEQTVIDELNQVVLP